MTADDREFFGAAARPTSPQSSPLTNSRLLTSRFLSNEERQTLADAIGPAKEVEAGTELAREHEAADTLFIVAEGWACRYTTTKAGEHQFPAVLVPGDVANLDSLLIDELDYGIRTLSPASIATLPRDRAVALATEHPGIARTFTWLAIVENTTLCKWAQSLGRRSSRERLAHLLCEFSVRLHVGDGIRSSFAFPMTQQQLADTLGLSTVHVNRTMQQLRSEGLVTTAGRTMTLPDMAQLRHVGGFDMHYLHTGPGIDAGLA